MGILPSCFTHLNKVVSGQGIHKVKQLAAWVRQVRAGNQRGLGAKREKGDPLGSGDRWGGRVSVTILTEARKAQDACVHVCPDTVCGYPGHVQGVHCAGCAHASQLVSSCSWLVGA